MGITAADLQVFDPVLKRLAAEHPDGMRIACLAYPDVVIAASQYDRCFAGKDWRAVLRDRPNRDKLLAIHGGNADEMPVIPTIESFFALYGKAQVDVIDFAQYEGSEIVHDLNWPLPPELAGKYHLVVDAGTTEHLFDIACGLFNCAKLAAVGGFVYHAVPMHALNHGFYNISPTLLFDFYEDNGFQSVGCLGAGWGATANPQFFKPPPFDRFRIDGEASVYYLANKLRDVDTLTKPIQRKYRNIEQWR